MTHVYSISERNYSSSAYSWGEFYETAIACEDYSEEERKKFSVFEALDKAITLEEIKEIIKPLTENEINWLNSPCLDGIVFSIGDPENKLLEKEYIETYKYYTERNLINLSLFQICKKGFVEIAKLILENRTITSDHPNIMRNYIFEIHHGIECTCALCAELFLSTLDNCIRIASRNGHIEIVKLLLVHCYSHISLNESLSEASEGGHIEIVKLLVQQHGVDPNIHEGFCIRYAARRGHTDIVQFLLQFQPSKKAVNEALDWAFRYGHAKTVKLLLDPTDLSIRSYIYSYFKEACIKGYTEIIKLLLSYKNPNEFSWNGAPLYNQTVEQFLRYCLDCAVEKGYIEIIKLLLENGAKLSKEHLILAVKNCHPKTIKFILDNGITLKDMHKVFKDQIETARIITECVLFSE